MTSKIELPIEAFDAIVIVGLKAAARTLCDCIMDMPATPMPHQYEDLQNNLRILDAINEVLEYFGEPATSIREAAVAKAMRTP